MAENPQLEQERKQALDQARFQPENLEQEADSNEPEVKKMGWGVFMSGILLIALQIGLAWVADVAAATIVASLISIICWVIGAGISIGLYFLLRPYRASMKAARIFWNISLVAGALPAIDSFGLDFIALVYAFIKSRSYIVQKVTSVLP